MGRAYAAPGPRLEAATSRGSGTAPVGALAAGQARQSVGPVAGQPPLQRPMRDPAVCGHTGQRDAVLEVCPQDQPMAMCFRAAGVAERGQRRLTGGARHQIWISYLAGSTAAGAGSLACGCSARYSVDRPIFMWRAMAVTDSPRDCRSRATAKTSSLTAAGGAPPRPFARGPPRPPAGPPPLPAPVAIPTT